jgi:hypothetical protein
VLVGARAHGAAVREHHIGLQQVVDRQPEPAGEVAEAAAERETADAGGRDDAARRGEAVLARGSVDLPPRAPAADAHRPRGRVDVDLLEGGEVDDDAVVARSQPAAVVAAAAYGERQVACAGEGDHRGHVVGAGAARDQGGPSVDHRVVDGAGVLVGRIAGADQQAAEAGKVLGWTHEIAHRRDAKRPKCPRHDPH